MCKARIKVKLLNQTYKEIDMSDYTYISEDIFAERDDIVKVEFPEGVKIIGSYAFEGCHALEEVTFPKSLEKIENFAFSDCRNLKRPELSDSVVVEPHAFAK